jgi:hypothetical protein
MIYYIIIRMEYDDDDETIFQITKKHIRKFTIDDTLEAIMNKLEQMDNALQQIVKQKEDQILILTEQNEYLNDGNIKLMAYIDDMKNKK